MTTFKPNNMRQCVKCYTEIDPRRLNIIPNTTQCVNCSDTDRVYGHVVITGKNTYSEVQIVDKSTSERLYKLGYRKGQGVASGVRFKFDPTNK